MVKSTPAVQETRVQSLGREDALAKEMQLLRYSCLGIPMDRGACRLQSTGSRKSWTQLND